VVTFSHSQVSPSRSLRGRLVYRASEHSFDFESEQWYENLSGQAMGSAPLLIDDLQLEVDIDTRSLLYVFGLRSHRLWQRAKLPRIKPTPGTLLVNVDYVMELGVGRDLVPRNSWISKYDAHSGCVYIGSEVIAEASDYVEFARGIVAALQGGSLVSLWLYPQIEGQLS